jgi:hypothetical protein
MHADHELPFRHYPRGIAGLSLKRRRRRSKEPEQTLRGLIAAAADRQRFAPFDWNATAAGVTERMRVAMDA